MTKGWLTGMVSYTLVGQPNDLTRLPNLLVFGLGMDIPVLDIIHVIAEGYYTVTDGGDRPEPDWATLNAGARIFFGHSGWALSAALNTNLNMLVDHGINPNPFGGFLGLTYAAWPPAPPPPVVVPAAAEPIVEQPAVAAPAPAAPAPAPSLRRARRRERRATRFSSTARARVSRTSPRRCSTAWRCA